jgi:hypothetical protein
MNYEHLMLCLLRSQHVFGFDPIIELLFCHIAQFKCARLQSKALLVGGFGNFSSLKSISNALENVQI